MQNQGILVMRCSWLRERREHVDLVGMAKLRRLQHLFGNTLTNTVVFH